MGGGEAGLVFLPDVRVSQGQTSQIRHGHDSATTDEDEQGDEL